MAADPYAGMSKLKWAYERARGQSEATMRLIDLGGAPNVPTEAIFEDIKISVPGADVSNSLGAVWYQELRDLVSYADDKGDYEGGNPNYEVINETLRQMILIRKSLGQPT